MRSPIRSLLFLPMVMMIWGCYESFGDSKVLYDNDSSSNLPFGMSAGPDRWVWSLRRGGPGPSLKVHKTNDGGDTWVDGSGTGLPECTGVRGAAILADRSDPEIAYVLWSGFYPGQADSEDLEIYNGAARTTNGGDTWEDAGTWGNTMSFVEIQMAQHPTLGTIMAAFAEDDQYMNVCRFSRSVNEGSSWMDHELLAGPLEDRWLRLYGLEYTDSGTLVAMLGSTIEAGMGFEPAYWYAKRSTTNGFIWSPLIQINTDEDGWFNYGGAIEPTGGVPCMRSGTMDTINYIQFPRMLVRLGRKIWIQGAAMGQHTDIGWLRMHRRRIS